MVTHNDQKQPEESSNFENNDSNSPYKPQEDYLVSDPNVASLFTHDKKTSILQILIHTSNTIMEISKELKMNPGTVKRHLDDLIENNLVQASHTVKNEFNITMKYYRATARKFLFHWSWP